MGDDSNFAAGGFVHTMGEDGTWHCLGQLVDIPELTNDGSSTPSWASMPPLSNYAGSITFKTPWWFDWTRMARMIMGNQYPTMHLRPRWTIRALRHGGKSHRGKHV